MNGESIEPPQVQGVRGQGCEVGAGSGRRGWWRQQDAVDIGWRAFRGVAKRTNLQSGRVPRQRAARRLSNRAFSYLKSAAAASEGLQHQRLPSMAYTLPLEMLVDMHLTSWAAAGDHEAIAALVPDYKVTPTGQSYAAQQSLLRPPLSYALPALVRLAAASGAVGTLTALRTAGKLFFEARRCTHTSPLTPLNPPTHDCRCRGLGEGSAGPCDARDSCEYRRAVDAERFHASCAPHRRRRSADDQHDCPAALSASLPVVVRRADRRRCTDRCVRGGKGARRQQWPPEPPHDAAAAP